MGGGGGSKEREGQMQGQAYYEWMAYISARFCKTEESRPGPNTDLTLKQSRKARVLSAFLATGI